jgi:hypothetical protein
MAMAGQPQPFTLFTGPRSPAPNNSAGLELLTCTALHSSAQLCTAHVCSSAQLGSTQLSWRDSARHAQHSTAQLAQPGSAQHSSNAWLHVRMGLHELAPAYCTAARCCELASACVALPDLRNLRNSARLCSFA